jgi:NAD+ kinase
MKLAFTASHSPLAQKALVELTNSYGQTPLKQADVIVALGGDGHVLRTLYDTMDGGGLSFAPVFALRRTESVGFLCNDYGIDALPERIARAQTVALHPLRLEAEAADGTSWSASAINEVTVLRETPQAVRLRILVDGVERIAQYSGDGVLVSTPAGSTAYNHSCGGPIMPLNANTLIMTAISGYRPRGWSYAVLSQDAIVEIEVLELAKRPVRIESGSSVIHNAVRAKIWHDRTRTIQLLFDPEQHLGERILREQFML